MHIITAVLVICSLGLETSHGAESEDCGVLADFVFVIDSSASIWEPDFNRSKEFIESVIRSFPIGPEDMHVAAVTFSNTVNTEFDFQDSEYWDVDTVAHKILDVPFTHGDGTLTHAALNRMTDEVMTLTNGARENVPHICVLVTDGESTYSSLTLEAAKKAKAAGITIIAIGVGDRVDKSEILSIVSEPAEENAIFKNSYTDLENSAFQQLVVHKACEVIKTTTQAPPTTTTTTTSAPPTTTTTTQAPTTTMYNDKSNETKEECQGKEADILFVLDMSSSIWLEDFKKQLQFVNDVVDNFDIESGKTRVGLISFSDDTKLGFNFGKHKNAAAVKAAVKKTTKDNGITNTHLALNATVDMFTEAHGSRPGVAHICILITDGISSVPKLTEPAARIVHDRGIYVMTIGVGNMTDKDELDMMASKPASKYSFQVKAYNVLETLRDTLAFQACKVPGEQSECLADANAKIMFGLYGIRGADRSDVTYFMKKVGGGFDLSKGKVAIGLQETCGSAYFPRTTFDSNTDYEGAVSEVMYLGMSEMIVNIRNTFKKPSVHSATSHVTILLVSGKSDDYLQAKKEVGRLRGKSQVIVVGVGDAPDEIREFATNPKTHVFFTKDNDSYDYIAKRVLSLLCKKQK